MHKSQVSPTFARKYFIVEFLYIAVPVILLSIVIARSSAKKGYPFWRTFIMAVIGMTGVGLIAFKVVTGLIP